MRSRVSVRFAVHCALVLAGIAVPAFGKDLAALTKQMPADLPMAIVLPDLQAFDRSLKAFMTGIDPSAQVEAVHEQLRQQLGIGGWIDFTKPLGIAQAEIGKDRTTVLWVAVEGFADKVKQVDGAEESDGVWHLPFAGGEDVFVRAVGDYLVVARSKDVLSKAAAGARTLQDALKDRAALLENRDALVHINVDSVRETLKENLSGVRQMAPTMLMMMAQQQPGMDPQVVTAAVTVVLGALDGLVSQLDVLDISLGVKEKSLDLTAAAGFRDGAIKTYLASRKPAGVELLAETPAQPFLLALGYHAPGEGSPFLDYIFDKLAAARSAPASPEPSADADAAKKAEALSIERIQSLKTLHQRAEGRTLVVGVAKNVIRVSGAYLGKDMPGIAELVRKHAETDFPMPGADKPGSNREHLGQRKIGDAAVDEWVLKTKALEGAAAAPDADLFGKEPRLAVGRSAGAVRFALGDAEYIDKAFPAAVEKPLIGSDLVASSVKNLPAKRNALLLVDPAMALPIFGPMTGLPATGDIPPGPPIAISVSVSGEPARIDIHVPAKAIERIVAAVSSQAPM